MFKIFVIKKSDGSLHTAVPMPMDEEHYLRNSSLFETKEETKQAFKDADYFKIDSFDKASGHRKYCKNDNTYTYVIMETL